MLDKGLHTRIQYWLCLAIALLLPFKTPVPLFIALLLLNWLLEGDFKTKFSGTGKHWYIFILFISFYLLHIIGLAWTENKDAGWFDLEVKLSFLVFPVIFFTRPLEEKQVKDIFLAFIAACSLSGLILLVRATALCISSGKTDVFFYENFSYFMHPGYYSMYLNLAFIYVLVSLAKPGNAPVRPWMYAALPYFALLIILLSSKLGMITLILTILSWLVWLVVSKRKYLVAGFSILALAGGFAVLYKASAVVQGRIHNAYMALHSDNIDKHSGESTAVRMLIWKAAREVIAEKPILGAGTGDAKDVLIEQYRKDDLTGAIKENLNAHNAYLEITVALGFAGLLLLVIGLQILPFAIGVKEGKLIYLLFILLLAINFLTEAMLETQAGVMFYAFFNNLLLFSVKDSASQS